MSMFKKLAGMAIVTVALAGLTSGEMQAGTVNWGANGAGLALSDGTTLVPDNSLVLLGTFGSLSDADIIAGAGDPTTLSNSFMQIDFALVGDNALDNPGLWSDSVSGDFTSTLATYAGKTIFVWAFNASTVGGATEQGIFKFNSTFPTDNPIPGTVDVDLGDLFSPSLGTVLVGSLGVGNLGTALGELPHVDLAAVPEPSSFVLVFGSLFFAARLRRRK